ncbi:MAG TPA: antitoxin AF2212-like protein [Candidatus Wunengus sp. YC63]|uniref:antitoxin AF2212-like protein n=1 Tax=unclassified Candidatus Wunengus TaxID=3367695 RepID=UPI004028694A
MNAIKGIYHNGVIELIEKPETQETSEVLIIFPEKKKEISKIGGLFKNYDINYEEIDEELKKLTQDSQRHILDETGD